MSLLRKALDVFWSTDIWLPPNITWADLEPNDKIQYADYRHLWYPFPMAALMLVFRHFMEKYWFTPLALSIGIKSSRPKKAPPNDILEKSYQHNNKMTHKIVAGLAKQLDISERKVERWLRLRRLQDKPSTLVKFCESSWKCTYYAYSFIYGVLCLWNKPWLWNINESWTNYPHQDKDYKKVTTELCKNVLGKDDYQLGKTKVFLKIKHDVSLEMARDRILEKRIKVIQKNAKMLYARNRYRKIKEATIMIQKFWRGYVVKNNYHIQRRGFLKLQACIKSLQTAFFYSKLRVCSINFQARCRGFLIRREITQKIKKYQLENKNEDSVSDMDAWITSVFKSALEETESSSL